MSKIFSHGPTPTVAVVTPQPAATPASAAAQTAPSASPPSPASAPASAAMPAPAAVDVAAILDGLAAKHSEKLDWKRSIVDLMKLVGMESTLSARKELADDLHFSGDKNDSASMNVWLHKAVLKKLSENGGKVPADLLD